jgi:uridylate kinase
MAWRASTTPTRPRTPTRPFSLYDSDPTENPDATFLPELTHMEAIERGLGVMDSTALSLCMDNGLPIHVFNLADERNIERIVLGERIGTIVGAEKAAS